MVMGIDETWNHCEPGSSDPLGVRMRLRKGVEQTNLYHHTGVYQHSRVNVNDGGTIGIEAREYEGATNQCFWHLREFNQISNLAIRP